MKDAAKYKIWAMLLLAPVFIAVGAYNFVMGNIQNSHAWFLWGLISMAAGILWILISKKVRQHPRK